jgi:hypothetical protein
MKPEVRRVVSAVLAEGTDDFVPLDTLIRHAQAEAEDQHVDCPGLIHEVVLALLEGGLAKIGDLGDLGDRIIPWPGAPEQVASQLVAQCAEFDWQPKGAGCWIENTPAGDAWVQRLVGHA